MTQTLERTAEVSDLMCSNTTVEAIQTFLLPLGVGMDALEAAGRVFMARSNSAQASTSLMTLTRPKTTYSRVTDTSRRSFADSLQRLHQHTGLDWGQIARTLGVTRRTVHNWLTGTRVNGVNAGRIAYLYKATLQEIGTRTPDEARAYLLSPGVVGVTPLSRITKALRADHAQSASAMGAVDLLRPAEDPVGPPVSAPLARDIPVADL